MMTDFTKAQQEAIVTIDRNVAVSAGAGSGKTRVLVERYIHILRQGTLAENKNIGVSDILAITFTRKAAAEMKERVRSGIEKLCKEDTVNSLFWKEQLQQLEKAQITTIHSLCNRILKENPVEAALDPAFQVAEEFESAAFLEKTIKSYFRQKLHQKDQPLELLIGQYGVHSVLNMLITLAAVFDEIIRFGDLSKPYVQSLQKADANKEILCHCLCTLVSRRGEATAKKQEQLQPLAENLDAILTAIRKHPADFSVFDGYFKGIRKDGVLKELIGDIKELRETLSLAAADACAVNIAAAWQQVIKDIADYILQKKIANDVLSFDDLENLALSLLKKNSYLCEKYQQKYRYIMVDEFQDTNEKQKQLIYLLCGGAEEQLKNNKLFIVGDPKQSIYRFRGADVSVFAQVKKDILAAGGKEITLADNFRTVDAVLNVCNEVFPQLLGENREQDIYFEPLNAHGTSMEKPLFLQIIYDKETKDTVRDTEALVVAEKIQELHKMGTGYEKMAVLLGAMTKCDVFTHAFDKCGIPYQVVDGKGFYEQQEILDMLNLFAFLHNKTNSIELAGILRSPYFGLDDETITALFIQKGSAECMWEAMQQCRITVKPEQQNLLSRAVAVLQQLRQNSAVLSLVDLWQEVWHKLHIEAVLSLQENGTATLANVKKLRQLAVEFSNGKHGTLGSWLEYTQNIISLSGRETNANINTENTVTIMTIHKSKGLEFDTVFLPFLDAKMQSDTAEIKFSKKLGLGFKVTLEGGTTEETNIWENIREEEKTLQAAERYRQLYVAMTRAKNRLIMSGGVNSSLKQSNSETWMQILQNILNQNETVIIEQIDAKLYLQDNFSPSDVAEKSICFDEDFLKPADKYELTGQSAFSATSLQTYLYCQRQYFYHYIAKLPALEPQYDGKEKLPPHIIGQIVHQALEKYAGDADKAFAYAVGNIADGNFYFAEPAEKLFKNYITSELFAAIPALHQREVKFTFGKEQFILTGIIDCIYENSDGSLTIVDFKTGNPDTKKSPKPGYMLQLALYKNAVEKITGKKVKSAELHFLQNLSVISFDEDEKTYLELADKLFREISLKKNDEKDFSCNLAVCTNCPYNYLCSQK